MLKQSTDQRRLEKDGKPFFYLADTVWSAFTNITLADWAYYLHVRKQQGFNVLQINILPQWDRSVAGEVMEPFGIKDGFLNLADKNEAYFAHAEKMLAMAVEEGFTPALVLLWCNYIPETWATKFGHSPAFRKEDVKAYTAMMMEHFNQFDPIYVISGDTDFPTENVTDYYLNALDVVAEKAPDALKVLHICGRLGEIPARLKNHPALDIYFYQSGHNVEHQQTAYTLAEHFSQLEPTKPVINSEPCYEMMGGYSPERYGRFSREDIRRAAWQSVLSGASAGITYGAHGIWSWHTVDSTFGSTIGEGFTPPFDWRQALHFEGANDYAFLKQFLLENQLTDLTPVDVLANPIADIRASESGDKVLLYVPSNLPVYLKGQFASPNDYAIDLETRKQVALSKTFQEGKTRVAMTPFTKDALYIFHK
ncbi:DUF4038 domain-containing protein [Listeria costaricensis]|uniref:apiosidase-like domain-containing protein n=1 Tax=Listeria costaricensis TaxID=2026604 RepID=UPI000C081980|nr:DUF4038 domain-containing protein [Listeria costaricensis]